jgi:hypothetical protein
VDPGGADQGQPTRFFPRRNRYVFSVNVSQDFGTNELVWTLTANGRTERAYASLRPEYAIDNSVMMLDGGSVGRLVGNDAENVPPTVTVAGGLHRTVRVGQPLTLTVYARDDGIPARWSEGGSRRPVIWGGGLRVAWYVYRGAGAVAFDPEQLTVYPDRDLDAPGASTWEPTSLPADGRYDATAVFEEPGTYVLRAIAHDGGLGTTHNVTVTVTEPETLRTAWGAPDLRGVWEFGTITPLQRPRSLGDRAVLTDEEVAAAEDGALRRQGADFPLNPNGWPGDYNGFWLDFGTRVVEGNRTSIIVDPPNGRLPPLRPGARRQEGSLDGDVPDRRPVRFRSGGIATDGPEDRGLAERCLIGFNTGPPMLPSGYNNMMQLFQTADHVAILHEMVHDSRIVPLDGRPHLPDGLRQLMGDSRGRWEGDTLVVETTGFTDQIASFTPSPLTALGSAQTMHLTERFARLNADVLMYEFTVDDPEAFSQTFRGVVSMRRSAQPVFEFACHEGNRAMTNLLTGARVQDRGTR